MSVTSMCEIPMSVLDFHFTWLCVPSAHVRQANMLCWRNVDHFVIIKLITACSWILPWTAGIRRSLIHFRRWYRQFYDDRCGRYTSLHKRNPVRMERSTVIILKKIDLLWRPQPPPINYHKQRHVVTFPWTVSLRAMAVPWNGSKRKMIFCNGLNFHESDKHLSMKPPPASFPNLILQTVWSQAKCCFSRNMCETNFNNNHR